MPRLTRRAGSVVALCAAWQVAACDSTVAPKPPPPPVASITVDSLVPGATARLRGLHMRQLAQLSVDGHAAAFRILSDTEAEFDVPHTRPCDTDDRVVDVVANERARTTARVRPAGVLRLEVGESRVLTAAQLACVQLRAASEDFVLAVASFATDPAVDAVVQLRSASVEGAGGVAASARPAAVHGLAAPAHDHVHELSRVLRAPPAHAIAPATASFSFDAYADAAVGDVLRFVDWSHPQAPNAASVDALPTYTATVVAVTAGQLIVIDDRTPGAATFHTAAAQARFRAAAEIADRVMLDALRAVIDPALQLPPGAGGRMVTTLLPMHGSGSIRIEDLQPRLGASNFYHALLSTALIDFSPETIARIMIHEAAHLADFEPWLRSADTGASSAGWYSEAVAVTVEDLAARLAVGAPRKARASLWNWPAGVPRSSIAHSASGSAPFASPFGEPGSTPGSAGPGAYDRGARIVRYAQELLGDGLRPGSPALHQRLAAAAPPRTGDLHAVIRAWSVDEIAAAVGLSTRELLLNSMLADLTNDLVPAAAVARWGLPQIEAWDHTPDLDRDYRFAASGRLIARAAPFSVSVSVPSGGYAYWYIPADDQAAGLSLEGAGISLRDHHEVRIIRLR